VVTPAPAASVRIVTSVNARRLASARHAWPRAVMDDKTESPARGLARRTDKAMRATVDESERRAPRQCKDDDPPA